MLSPLSLTTVPPPQPLPNEGEFRDAIKRATFWPATFLLTACAALIGLVLYLFRAAELVDHTHQVIGQATRIERLGDDTRIRRLTGSESATDERGAGMAAVQLEAEFATLAEMVADNPVQVENAQRARTQWMAWKASAPGLASAEEAGLFTAFRATMTAFTGHEERLLSIRSQTVRRARNVTIVLLSLAILIGAPVLVMTLRRIIRRMGDSYDSLLGTTAAQRDELYTSLRSIGDAVVITDADGNVAFLNPVAEQLTGWTSEEAQGRPLTEVLAIFNEETGEPAVNPVARVLKEKIVVGLANHTVLRPRQGPTIPIEDSAAPIFDASGIVRGVILVFHDVSEKYAREKALRDSEWISRTALEVAGAGAWSWDISRNLVFGDAVLARTFGVPVERCREGEPIETFLAAIHPEDRDRVQQEINASLAHGASYALSYRVTGEGGVERWVDSRGRVERDGAGRPMRLPGVLFDETGRKQAEAERDRLLEEKEQQRRLYETILGATPDFVYVFGLDHRFTYVNKALLKAWGRTNEEALGRNCLELGYEKWHAEKHDREIEEVVATGRPIHSEVPFSAAGTGGRRIYDYIFVPVFDGSGEVVAVAGTTRDVTVRKQVEQMQASQTRILELIAQGAEMRGVLNAIVHTVEEHAQDAMKVSILLVDTDGKHLRFGAAPRMPEEFSRAFDGIPIGEGVVSCGTAAFRRQPVFVADTATDALWNNHADLAKAHGLRACWSTPFFSGAGELLGTLAIYFPETRQPSDHEARAADVGMRLAAMAIERSRAQSLISAEKERAESANRAKDDFLAALSHELRTPLTPVLMAAAVLREDERLPEEVRRELSMIQRNVLLEAQLIDDLLDLTRIAKGKILLRETQCDVHSLIALATEIVRDDALAKPVKLALDLRAKHYAFRGDPARLQQVFWNLLRNAIKFTPMGGEIAVQTVDAPGNCLTINVTDTGVGIDAGALEKIFHPFEQAGLGNNHRFGGLGLGLAIARAIVDLHGGKIHARSEGRGRGATFTVELPGVSEGMPQVADESPTTGQEATMALPHSKSAPCRILLLEDHEPTLAVLARLLGRVGHEVVTASTVAAAVTAARRSSFDILISDLGLPDGTGLEAMEELRRMQPTLRGIALSGYGMDDDVQRSLKAGFAMHMTKPVDINALQHVLQEILSDQRRAQ